MTVARIGPNPAARRNVLLVSPRPPPVGGMQTWTEIALERGLPALVLMGPRGLVGIALGGSAGTAVQAALLSRGLVRCGAWSLTPGLGRTLVGGWLGSAAMAVGLVWMAPAGAAWFEAGPLGGAAMLGAAVAGGAVLYAVAVVALGVRPAHLRLGA